MNLLLTIAAVANPVLTALLTILVFLESKKSKNQIEDIQKYIENKSLFLEIDLKNCLAKSKDLNFILEIKESSRKMFLSGEWDATATLLENETLVERKSKELPYIKFDYYF